MCYVRIALKMNIPNPHSNNEREKNEEENYEVRNTKKEKRRKNMLLAMQNHDNFLISMQ